MPVTLRSGNPEKTPNLAVPLGVSVYSAKPNSNPNIAVRRNEHGRNAEIYFLRGQSEFGPRKYGAVELNSPTLDPIHKYPSLD
jgi:hypothetical protein